MIEKRIKFSILLILIIIALMITPGVIIGGSPLDSPTVYQLFMDWLQGKPGGLVKFIIKPKINGRLYDGGSELIIAIHNITQNLKVSRRIIYCAQKIFPSTFMFKIWRIPINYVGREIRYQIQEFIVLVMSKDYFGAKIVQVEPRKPITEITVEIPLKKNEKIQHTPTNIPPFASANSLIIRQEESDSGHDVSYDHKNVKCGQVHSISGIEVKWRVEPYETNIYLEGFTRNIYYDQTGVSDSGWVSSGAKLTQFLIGTGLTARNGEAFWILGDTKFRCELWWDEYSVDENFDGQPDIWWRNEYYIMVPEYIDNIEKGPSISCSSCNKPHQDYANKITQDHELPYQIGLRTGLGSEWAATSIELTFYFVTAGYTIIADVEVTLYRGADGKPPILNVYVNNWLSDILWWWYENDDPNAQIVHFSWL